VAALVGQTRIALPAQLAQRQALLTHKRAHMDATPRKLNRGLFFFHDSPNISYCGFSALQCRGQLGMPVSQKFLPKTRDVQGKYLG
jgi:hypothetical protein